MKFGRAPVFELGGVFGPNSSAGQDLDRGVLEEFGEDGEAVIDVCGASGREDSFESEVGNLVGGFYGVGEGIEGSVEGAGSILGGLEEGFVSFDVDLVIRGEAGENESVCSVIGKG